MLLVDHRGHGKSATVGDEFSTLAACGEDLETLFSELGLPCWPSIVIGHSFGGKVALELSRGALRTKKSKIVSPARHTWVLDALPGATDGNRSLEPQSVSRVLTELRDILPFDSRGALVRIMKKRGFSETLAQWMTTNTKPTPDGRAYEWAFDLNTIEALFEDYRSADYWPMLRNLDGIDDAKVHFVRAGLNEAWTPSVLADFEVVMNHSEHCTAPYSRFGALGSRRGA